MKYYGFGVYSGADVVTPVPEMPMEYMQEIQRIIAMIRTNIGKLVSDMLTASFQSH